MIHCLVLQLFLVHTGTGYTSEGDVRTLYGVETLTLVEALASIENVLPSQNKGPCFDAAPRTTCLLNMKPDNCTVEGMQETVHKWLAGQYRTNNRDLRLLVQESIIWNKLYGADSLYQHLPEFPSLAQYFDGWPGVKAYKEMHAWLTGFITNVRLVRPTNEEEEATKSLLLWKLRNDEKEYAGGYRFKHNYMDLTYQVTNFCGITAGKTNLMGRIYSFGAKIQRYQEFYSMLLYKPSLQMQQYVESLKGIIARVQSGALSSCLAARNPELLQVGTNRITEILDKHVVSPLRQILGIMENDGFTSGGLSSIGDEGKRYYKDDMIELHTTMAYDPEYLMKLGKKQARKVRGQLRNAVRRLSKNDDPIFNSSMSFQQVLVAMDTAPLFQYATSSESETESNPTAVTAAEQDIKEVFAARRLRSMFDKGVVEGVGVPSVYPTEQGSMGFYTSSGEFYISTRLPPNKLQLRTLTCHEAIPGHHLQIKLANLNKTSAAYLRASLVDRLDFYTEGWGMYAETLCREAGLTQGHQNLGRLQFLLARVLRIVVDTGLHYFDWPRFYISTRLPPNKLQLRTLTCHEAIPGHHLQIKLANLNKTSAAYLRSSLVDRLDFYTEGWGMYAESLCREAGLTQGHQNLGRLQFLLARVLRIVVDTGLHYFDWPREKAEDYVMTNLGMGREMSEQFVSRAIGTPGQYLSYYIGMVRNLERGVVVE
eukprot:sb/3462565/